MGKIEVACKCACGCLVALLMLGYSCLTLSPVLLPLVLAYILIVVGLLLVVLRSLKGLLDHIIWRKFTKDHVKVLWPMFGFDFNHGKYSAYQQIVFWELADEISLQLIKVSQID